MFPIHPPEECQGIWRGQGVLETCRADNSDGKKNIWSFWCTKILPHFLLLNAALKESILASNEVHFFKNLKLIYNYQLGKRIGDLADVEPIQAEKQMLLQMAWSMI